MASSSLTGITALWSLSKNIKPSLVLVQSRKTHPCLTERLLMGRKESNQTKNINNTIVTLQQESIFQQQSPTKRRESTPLLDKIKTDVNMVKQKVGNNKQGDKPKEVKEELAIMKYITSQVGFYIVLWYTVKPV